MFARITVAIAFVHLVQAVGRLPLRLNGSEDSYSGELQVYVNGTWGSFCYTNSIYGYRRFSFTTANLLCKTLGFKTVESVYRINYTDSNAPVTVDRVYCYRSADSFFNCSWYFYSDYNFCWNNATVGVVCSDDYAIRLVKSNSSQHDYEGRVEVFHSGRWGTVCNRYRWSTVNSRVVCQELGYPDARTGFNYEDYGSGPLDQPVWLENVYCSGTEESLVDCYHYRGWSSYYCNHTHDVGVSCLDHNEALPVYHVRLVDQDGNTSPNRSTGRVEIYYNGTWGTVCDDGWGIEDANVVCRQLGFRGALASLLYGAYGRGNGTIWIDDVLCRGSEEGLSQCLHSGWGVHDCSHYEDASVICDSKLAYGRSYNTEGIFSDTEQLKKTYTSQIESMKETLKFRISSLENENSELQSRAGSYEEKYNELVVSRKKDQDLYATAQQKCHEATQKLEAQNAELNVQMTDMQNTLDTFRLDRLRIESLRQNCFNQLAMSRMKFGQLQEEFQQMSSKLKAMGNAFNDNQPAVQDKQVSISEATKTPSSQMRILHTDKPDTTDRHMVKKNVLSALEKKLAQGEKLEDSEQMLYQALAKEAGKVMDLKRMNKEQDRKDAPEWVKNLPAEHTRSISKEAQDFLNKPLNKPGNNIPAPPFLDEYKDIQQQQRQKQANLVLPKLHLDDKLDLNEKPAAVDEQKTFEQDQRDEERRLFEMFQGDNNHDKDEFKDGLKDDGDERLARNNELYDDKEDEEDDEDEDDDDDDDNDGGDDYKVKDDNYVYGGQDHKVNPDMQNNNALI